MELNKLLDISDLPGLDGDDVTPHEELVLTEVKSDFDSVQDIRDDYEVVRRNLHYQSQMIFDAAKIFLESAKNADSPRYIEAFSTLMGQMTTTNKELLRIHKDIQDSRPKEPIVNNESGNTYILSTSDLLSELGSAQDVRLNKE